MSPPPAGRIRSIEKRKLSVDRSIQKRLDGKKDSFKRKTSLRFQNKKPVRKLSNQQRQKVNNLVKQVSDMNNATAKKFLISEFKKNNISVEKIFSDVELLMRTKRTLRLIFKN